MKSEKVEEAWKNFLALAERLPLGVQAEVGHLARLLVDAEVRAALDDAHFHWNALDTLGKPVGTLAFRATARSA